MRTVARAARWSGPFAALAMLLLAACGRGATNTPSSASQTQATPVPPKLSVYAGGMDGTVYALRASDGAMRWKYATGGAAGMPVYADGVVYVVSQDRTLYALNASDGSLVWKTALGVESGDPVVAGHLVLVSAPQAGYVTAYKPGDGTQAWRYTAPGCSITSLAADDAAVYFSPAGCATPFTALALKTGQVAWQAKLGLGGAAPAVVNDVVYVNAYGTVYAAKSGDGTVLWHAQTAQSNNSFAPLAQGGVVYVSDDLSVYALGASDGSVKWHVASNALVQAEPAIAANGVAVALAGGTVQTLGKADGSALWSWKSGVHYLSAPASTSADAAGSVYLSASDGPAGSFSVDALRSSDGTRLWQYVTTAAVQSVVVAPSA
jgi:outer membrane protein assembly factor BamB